VAETDEQALEQGRELMWYLGRKRHAALTNPPGFNSVRTNMMMMRGIDKPRDDSFESLMSKGIILCGSPTTVARQAKEWHKRGVGHLLMMQQAGAMTPEVTRRSLELFAKEVYPELRELDAHSQVDGSGQVKEPAVAAQQRIMNAEG
jgi:alkanesulfonate monooxygenase SsuD/methylene tetrahydromethanopterin reductase-like flavin-dependent oxidoreductase (luciferase family)